MRYAIQIEGFEGHEIAVELSNPFRAPRLLLDGMVLTAINKGRVFQLTRNDGRTVAAELKPTAMGSGLSLMVEGLEYSFMEPLTWYQWAWAEIPVLLVTMGGCIGGALGGGALFLNLRIFRSLAPGFFQYVLTGLVTVGCMAGYLVLAGSFHLALGGKPKASTTNSEPAGAAASSTRTSKPKAEPMVDGSPRMDLYLRELIQSPSTVPNSNLVRQVDAHVEKLSDPQQRQNWKLLLGSKICRNAEKLQGDWANVRLLELLKTEPALKAEAINALMDRGETDSFLPLLPDLDAAARKAAIQHLSMKYVRDRVLSGPGLTLAITLLKDPDPNVRATAFELLCNQMISDAETRSTLGTCLRGEKDSKLQARLAEHYLRALTYQRPKLTSQDYLDLAFNGPSRGVVKEALERLFADFEKRKAHLATLVERFSQADSTENRAWLMLELNSFRLRPDTFVLYDRGLTDSSPSVRAAAVCGRLESLHQPGPDSERIQQLVQSETDPQAREQMTRAFQLWSIKWYEHLRRSPKTRPEAHQKLVELASSPDAEVASAALGVLPLFQAGDVEILPALLAVFQQAASVPLKARILGKIEQLEDDRIYDFYRPGLVDPQAEVRRSAFISLSNNYRHRQTLRHPQDPKIMELLQAALSGESDASLKKRMEEILADLQRR